jgi:hypothetical protein
MRQHACPCKAAGDARDGIDREVPVDVDEIDALATKSTGESHDCANVEPAADRNDVCVNALAADELEKRPVGRGEEGDAVACIASRLRDLKRHHLAPGNVPADDDVGDPHVFGPVQTA